jgi:hypothetical protein
MSRIKHGESAQGGSAKTTTPEYRSWVQMIARCYCTTHHKYPQYGGRGITVCRRWRGNYVSFLADMGRRPSPQHTLDRRNTNRGYSPGNCRWATRTEQNRNRRSNRMLTVAGVTRCAAEWSEVSGIPLSTLIERLRAGYSHERAVTQPLRPYRRKHEQEDQDSP